MSNLVPFFKLVCRNFHINFIFCAILMFVIRKTMNKLILIIASIQLYLLVVKQANELNIKTIIKSLAIS